MNFQEQLKYDGLQRMKSRLKGKQAKLTVQTITETTKVAVEGPKTIEIAGKKILAMPLETIALTPEQQKKFEEVGGHTVDCSKMTQAEQKEFAKDNPEAPIDWQVSFEKLQLEIDGTLYKGFDLFKKVYEAFPVIRSMTKEEATERGLYPIIHYRNFVARKWMAGMNGGHLATLDKDYNGELRDIYNATEGKTNLQKLATMGQAPLGGRGVNDAEVYGLGDWAKLGSGSLGGDGELRILEARHDETDANNSWYWQGGAVSSVVVLDK